MTHAEEVRRGCRFRFGANWRGFLATVDEERVRTAQSSLEEMLGAGTLAGMRLLDAGSGSGLFSLAARRLGARVVSFDYDPESVACTRELKRRFLPEDPDWEILEGSVLDPAFLESLGRFDVVYSWGVLHHTGHMWRAFELALARVQEPGCAFVALYNDRGWRSRYWLGVKRLYCSGILGRGLVLALFVPAFAARAFLLDALRARDPFARYRTYRQQRGMSLHHDWIDWLGGYPYEVASPEDVVAFAAQRGFVLARRQHHSGLGNNQFVFRRDEDRSAVLDPPPDSRPVPRGEATPETAAAPGPGLRAP